MAGPALRHCEDPRRAAARVRREAHGRGAERRGRPRGVDDSFLGVVRSEPGYTLPVEARLHDSGDRIRAGDREEPARARRRRRGELPGNRPSRPNEGNDRKLKYPGSMSGPVRGKFGMASTMKAAVKSKPAPKSTEIRTVPIPSLGPTEVLIRVKVASICGTDVH